MRREGHTLSRFVVSSVFLIGLHSAVATAAPITLSGGFTSFTGMASGAAGNGTHPPTSVSPGCISEFQAFVGGVNVVTPSCAGSLSGPASLTFASTLASVEFHETDFGNCCGTPPPNLVGLALIPNQDVANIDSPFALGTFTFQNGTWFGLGPVNSFHIEITAGFPFPYGTQSLIDDVVMDIRVGNTPIDNVDCVFFSRFVSQMGRLCANEGETVTATLMGMHGSLIPTQWTNVQGGIVLSSPAAVPEPTTLVLLGSGLAAIWTRRRRS